MKTAILALSFVMAASAYAEDKKTAPAAAPAAVPATQAVVTATTPVDACKLLVEAAKTENYDTVAGLSTWPAGKHEGKSKGKFAKMHNDYLGKIKGITCGTATVADEHAVVEAQSEGKKRLIPFVNQEGNWKFNVQAYKAFYDAGPGHKGHHGHKKSM